MLRRFALTGALAAMCAGVAIAQSPGQTPGQTPGQPTGQTPTTQQDTTRERASQQAGMTTVSGCVYREQDVPGRSPNIAERAGMGEDYILADIKPGGSQAGASASQALSGHRMVKLEGVDDERLRSFVGQRVEVTGRMSGAAARGASPTAQDEDDQQELADFEVSSIRQVSGDCPSTPQP